MSPKQQRSEATIDRTLTRHSSCYAAKGHKGLTMTGLIAETGISSGSLYHHFGSIDGSLPPSTAVACLTCSTRSSPRSNAPERPAPA